jgi:hypothetical protein
MTTQNKLFDIIKKEEQDEIKYILKDSRFRYKQTLWQSDKYVLSVIDENDGFEKVIKMITNNEKSKKSLDLEHQISREINLE